MKKILSILTCALVVLTCLTSCGEVVTSLAEHTHSFGEPIVTEQPTCSKSGKAERHCPCGEILYVGLEPLSHDLTEYAGEEPTCTRDGYKNYVACRNCGYSTYESIPATGHDFKEIDGQPPSCTIDGYGKYTVCTLCGFSTYAEIPSVGHEFGGWIEIKPATCAEEGIEERRCILDETHTESRAIPKLPHTPGGWLEEYAASCGNEGSEYRECLECGKILETRITESLGHNWGIQTEILAATCTDNGVARQECLRCGEMREQETEQLGHSYGDWVVITAPTCSEAGEEARVCSRDESHTETRKIDKLPHDFRLDFTESGHYKVCASCGITAEAEPHNFDGNECSICGFSKGAVDGVFYTLSDGSDYYTVSGAESGIGEIILPSVYNGKPVKEIAENAFRGNVGLTRVTVPDSIEKIGANSFFGCNGLTEIALPFTGSGAEDVITHFGYIFGASEALQNADFVPSSLKKVTLTAGKRIAAEAFLGCENISEIVLPQELESVGANAFRNCTGINTIELPHGLKLIETQAFFGCTGLESVILPESLTEIGSYAFYGCGFETVEFTVKQGWALFENGEEKGTVSETNLQNLSVAATVLTNYYSSYLWKRV